MNIENFIKNKDLFIRELILNGMSKHTINAYNRDLCELFNNLEKIPNCNNKMQIKKEYFIWCLKKLSQASNHPRTIARKLSTWKSYINFLLKNKLINTDIISTLKAPKQPNRLPKAINMEDIQSIFSTKEKNDDFFTKRDNAIFELMYGTGIRLSELTNLNLDDVILDEGWMYIHSGKGNKDRQLPIGSKAIEAIENYLKVRPNTNNQALFISKNGTRISPRRVQQCLNEWGLRHNANQHLSPHMLRHSFATHMLRNSHNIRAVQELLGHSQLSTTQIYTKLDMGYLLDVYNKSHPRAKKK